MQILTIYVVFKLTILNLSKACKITCTFCKNTVLNNPAVVKYATIIIYIIQIGLKYYMLRPQTLYAMTTGRYVLPYGLAWPDRFFPFHIRTGKKGKNRSGHARLVSRSPQTVFSFGWQKGNKTDTQLYFILYRFLRGFLPSEYLLKAPKSSTTGLHHVTRILLTRTNC